MFASRVLIVDTPARGLWSLAARLRLDGHEVIEVSTTGAASAEVARGVAFLLVHHKATVDLPAVLGAARGADSGPGVMAIVDGADDGPLPPMLDAVEVIRVPCDLNELCRRVGREVAGARARRRLHAFQRAAGARLDAGALIGESEPMARVRTVLRKVAASGVPVLVTGEVGTGHALVARTVHGMSDRGHLPFVRVDCTARESLPVELLGADDGADAGAGALEVADEGTVWLEHVDRLTPALQVGVLRAIEDGSVRREGSLLDRATGVRIVASTTMDLEAEVHAGRFRRDLYHRLSVARLDLPPLRQRGKDVALLAAHFAAIEGSALRQQAARVDESAVALLTRYGWPGNVRELRHAVARAVLLAPGDTLTREHFAALDPDTRRPAAAFRLPEEGVDLDALERQLVVQALERAGGHQTRAAELLGLHRDQIRYRIVKYGLRRQPPV